MTLVHGCARRSRVAVDYRALIRRGGGWGALALSVALYATVSLLLREPFHAGGLALRYFDLRIYRLGALRLAHGSSLYAAPMLDHLGFTYPPFAAMVMRPLAWSPLLADELAVTCLNVLLLVWTARRTLLIPFGRHAGGLAPSSAGRAPAWSLAAALAAVALWSEPVSVTLGYGQINLLIAGLVVFDLSRPDRARTKGVAIGVAAALKLTPLLFIAYLLLSRRTRAAAVAAATFAASIAVGEIVVPRDSSAYWLHALFHTSRIGNAIDPMNQSLTGVIARVTGATHPTAGGELLIVAFTACGLGLAVRASRRGDEAAGFSLAALSTLLASPISWSHHWTLAIPALILLAGRARVRRSRALAAAAGALAVAAYAYLPEIAHSNFGDLRGLASLPTTDPYPILALLVLAACLASAIRAHLRQPGRLRRARRPLRPAFAPEFANGRLGDGLRR